VVGAEFPEGTNNPVLLQERCRPADAARRICGATTYSGRAMSSTVEVARAHAALVSSSPG
jgi:hypothetical protein